MENMTTETTTTHVHNEAQEESGEILIVASKLKAYIKQKGSMNTSDAVMKALSHRVRQLCDTAMERARAEGRKTVMDRDFS